MQYKVFHSESFDKQLKKYPSEFHDWLDKIEDQLAEKPLHVGDPLRVPWLREKKHDKYRVYYLIYDDIKAVYLIAIANDINNHTAICHLLIRNGIGNVRKLNSVSISAKRKTNRKQLIQYFFCLITLSRKLKN